jgi:hypothetical protein
MVANRLTSIFPDGPNRAGVQVPSVRVTAFAANVEDEFAHVRTFGSMKSLACGVSRGFPSARAVPTRTHDYNPET